MSATHPCLRCGACCATFRVSFYWAEADDASPGGVPAALTDKLTPHRRVMRGTNQPAPRCSALLGDIGSSVRCTIHPQRSSTCRDFAASYEDGTGAHNPRCDQARTGWGLAPLTREDWSYPFPEAPTPMPLPGAA